MKFFLTLTCSAPSRRLRVTTSLPSIAFAVMLGLLTDVLPSAAADSPPAVAQILDRVLAAQEKPVDKLPPTHTEKLAELERLSAEYRNLRGGRESFERGLAAIMTLAFFFAPTLYQAYKLLFLAPTVLAWTGLVFLRKRQGPFYARFRIVLWIVAAVMTLLSVPAAMAADTPEEDIQLVNRLYGLTAVERAIARLEVADELIELPSFRYRYPGVRPGKRVPAGSFEHRLALSDLLDAAGRTPEAQAQGHLAVDQASAQNSGALEALLARAIDGNHQLLAEAAAARLVAIYRYHPTQLIYLAGRVAVVAPLVTKAAVEAALLQDPGIAQRVRSAQALLDAGHQNESRVVLERAIPALGKRDIEAAKAVLRGLDDGDLVGPLVQRALLVDRTVDGALAQAASALELGDEQAAEAAIQAAGSRAQGLAGQAKIIERSLELGLRGSALALIEKTATSRRDWLFQPVLAPQQLRPFEEVLERRGQISLAVLAGQLLEMAGDLDRAEGMHANALGRRLQSVLTDYVHLDGSLAEYAIVYDFFQRSGRRPELVSSLARTIEHCAGDAQCGSVVPDRATQPARVESSEGRSEADIEASLAHLSGLIRVENTIRIARGLSLGLGVLILLAAFVILVSMAWVEARQLYRLRTWLFLVRCVENIGWVFVLSVVLALHGILIVLLAQWLLNQTYQARPLGLADSWKPVKLFEDHPSSGG